MGSSGGSTSWHADYLVSGQIDAGAQKWVWSYFSMTDKEVPGTLGRWPRRPGVRERARRPMDRHGSYGLLHALRSAVRRL
jgi:hypothetical protein